ncbi:uracil phosphoribosyltransferase [Hahella chejuensis]|nr:uracil phosphoribosyltransferase [Hahella chejuensis]
MAAPEGVSLFREEHPEVPGYAGVIDSRLDNHAYIRPGVGDAGDRIVSAR